MKRIFSKQIFSLLFVLLLLLPMGAQAAGIVDYTADFYVADYANVLDDQTEGLIVLNNDQLDKACGAQIVVVTVNEVSSVASIENYAYTLFNQWGIGDKAKNNGLLILIAVNEGTYWMMPGKGLQDYITAGDLDAMAAEHFESAAAMGNFDEAVRQLFGACFDKMAIAYNVKLSVDDSLYYKWIQNGQQSSGGARFLSAPLKAAQESTPVQEVTPTEKPAKAKPVKEDGGFPIVPIAIILIVVAAVVGMSRMRKTPTVRRTAPPPPPPAPRPNVNPYRTPVRTTRPPTAAPPRPPMGNASRPAPRPPMGNASRPVPRPPMGTPSRPAPRPPMGSASRPAPRPPMGTPSRPASRPPMGGTSRPAGGGMTRGGGSGGSFGGARPKSTTPKPQASRPSSSRPSGGGFGGGRSGGGGSTRGGGSGGAFR